MPKYMVQVVLHEAPTAAKYAGLSAAMAKRGFSREMPGKKASYHLPTGNFWFEGDQTPNDVRESAAVAMETADEDFGIIVVRVDGWSVMRLKKVPTAKKG